MKRIIACCIMAAVIFAGGAAALYYTDKAADEIIDNLRLIESCFLKDDKEGAEEAAEKMEEGWDNFRKLHILTVDNDHALEITMSAARISDMLRRDNEDVLTECKVMEELIRVYREEQEPSILNIL